MNLENINFVRQLIKGKIAEIIFEQMFRESEEFTILRSGYEYTLPELAQYQHFAEVKAVMTNIRNAPDFILISQNKKEVFLVEVKYRSQLHSEDIRGKAEGLLKTWNPSWLFVATPECFFFDSCNTIINNDGKINKLSETWVNTRTQSDCLKLLNEFEPVNK